jgi:hypothetical protein
MNATILASFAAMTSSLVMIIADATPFAFIGMGLCGIALLAIAISEAV